jgi:methionine synthase II (cobalamin-independent)
MTEPIKLPPLPRPPIHLSNWTNELCEWAKDYATDAVEQATADLRAELARKDESFNVVYDHCAGVIKSLEKAEVDLAEVQAELTRLRTLRPMTEDGDPDEWKQFWCAGIDGLYPSINDDDIGSQVGWTPLLEPTESESS